MGTRDDLLAAAKQCLAERGYARTTVRDIVAASGANLAAINYHFRSRDALLNLAMVESVSDAMRELLAAPADGEAVDARARLEEFWARLVGSFGADRALWAANIEALAQALHSPEVRAPMADGQHRARGKLADLLGPDSDADAGAVIVTLLNGLLVQWMIDPERAPTGAQLTAGVLALADALKADEGS
ncbi:TetR/AcrR family transcriptional regulator [Streptomyces sp. UNOC14_S4]|uniref:TetR/AcrR family transcriptional regulator n=1 Tax=Streptomyces sp. UNOC14_S4 TaxID=2872340 RepID=UPI001E37E255|nr:TetR/AcrR family transcriptional regulator [Streptomyces sp. UNOC14_S4]MCC3772526.1 TetR/AcrR family transcriptional regulator [Streptomyces sp. UNOC14_S4]